MISFALMLMTLPSQPGEYFVDRSKNPEEER